MAVMENVGSVGGEKCQLCRRPLGSREQCRRGLCLGCVEEVADYLARFKLSDEHRDIAINHLWTIAAASNRVGKPESHHVEALRLTVPTYYGSAKARYLPSPSTQEFDAPFVPILARSAEGIKLVLGSHDPDDPEAADIQVERRPGGWVIFLNPVPGGDSSGYICMLDDGRSYAVPESGIGTIERLRIRLYLEDVAEVNIPPNVGLEDE